MPRYRITVAYDGTQYGGWQIQPNSVTIQALLEKALATLLGTPSRVVGSGRTDSGVHALGQVAHFDAPSPLDIRRARHSFNALLPSDIRVLTLEESEPSFHARFTAKRKIYHYHLHLDLVRSPFKRGTSHHVKGKCNLDLLKEAAALFVGTHDFRSFTNQAETRENTVRTLYRLDVVPEEGGIRLEFEGNGFLYKMVRNIVGTLIEIARGKIPIDSVRALFDQKNRNVTGQAAPPEGLFLVKVLYQ